MKTKQLITRCVMLALAVVGFAIRLYRVDAPVADWHSWRQVDTASVARNYLKNGIDLLHPRYDDLSNIPSGRDNPQGWRMVEFPIYQGLAVVLKQTVGVGSIEVWLRLISIVAMVAAAFFLGLIVSHYSDLFTGIVVEAVFLFLPYSIFFGRTILPDVLMMSLATISVYAVTKVYTDTEKKSQAVLWFWLITGALTAGLTLLVKPVGIFLLLPAIYLFLVNWKLLFKNRFLFIGLLGYWLIGLIPILWWRKWILQFPEGIPGYEWLLNGGNIRFKGAWFWWLFGERLGKLILGYWGVVPMAMGIIVNRGKKESWLYWSWLAGMLAFWVIVAKGNVQHDYYQISAIPAVSIFVGKGIVAMLRNSSFELLPRIIMTLVIVVFGWAFSWYTMRTYYWINKPEIVEVGQAADKLLPKDAKVIAPYNGDTTFLYQTGRAGWPLGFDIDKKIALGATHYVTISPTDEDWETRDLANKYTVLVRNEKYAIIDLTRLKGQ